MGGYIDRAEPAAGTHDPLFAKAAAFRLGERAALLLALDILCVSGEWVGKLRERVSGKLGLAPESILVAATHTHSAPAVFFPKAGGTGPIARYEAALIDKCAEAVERAHATAAPARVLAGCVRCEGVAANRRDPRGPTDDLLSVVRIESPRGKVKGRLVSFPCHPTVMGPSNLQYSADLFGAAAKEVEKKYPDSICIMFNGAAADASTRLTRREQSWAEIERLGRELARGIIAADRASKPAGASLIRSMTASMTFPFREIPEPDEAQKEYDEALAKAGDPAARDKGDAGDRLARSLVEGAAARLLLSRIGGWRPLFGADAAELELQAIRINDIIVCGLPGEFFASAGSVLRKAALPKLGFVIGYANGYCGYIVPPEEAQKGGYEAMMSPLVPECEPKIIGTAGSLIREIGQPR